MLKPTKQKVSLIYASPLCLISNAIRYSHDNHNLSDTESCSNGEYSDVGEKDMSLIKRVGVHMNHSSTLEHSLIVFDVHMTTKALLEESRHRIGLSQTVTSSRYALDLIDVEFETNRNPKIENFLQRYKNEVVELINSFRNEKGKISKKDMDDLAEVLPQCFIYKMQLTFNLRSLIHFLKLRANKSAHIDIRIIANQLFEVLPYDYQEIIKSDKFISDNLETKG